MLDMMIVLGCVSQCLDATALRQLTRIIEAMLSMTGRVTMLGVSRWAGPGGSYRTVQRFFHARLNWCGLQWALIRCHLLDEDDVIVVGGDDVVTTKSGKQTYGLDRFFSSLYGKQVPGLCFLCISLISVKRRTSYPVLMEQHDERLKEKTPEAPKKKSTMTRGRPKGSKNQNRREVELSPYLLFVQDTLKRLLGLVGDRIQATYFVFDGAFGHNDALHMVRQMGLHLVSKLRHDSALYFPYQGDYSGRGKPKKYGDKLNYKDIPDDSLKESSIEKDIETKTYQMQLWHKKFADLLNVVVIVKTNLKTHKVAHVVLFSSDLDLPYDLVIDYYRLRFQIEFNFRDAKQYWGLEDFMVVKETPVYNSANLALFMVNVSQALMRPMRAQWPELSVNDLKTWFRSRKYVVETLKLLPEMPEPIFIDQAIARMAELGRVNHAVNTG
jgi:putative transposase